ncbi:MAG TPA: acyl-CoA dehydrogenase family protein [Planctomycetaceae bacterium]|jgi:alkylation response protein AidB-like acyl-CoA dehydrogenase
MTVSTPNPELDREQETFVETALKLSGKSAEEARTTGAIDRADDQVEKLFAPKYQTTGSPVHRAVWDSELPGDLFVAKPAASDPATQAVMQKSLDVVRERRKQKLLFDAQGKVSRETLEALSGAGYFGLLVDREYGGQGASFQTFAKFLTQMAVVDATVAGLASVHGCIGAVDPLRTFGSPDQKQRYLPLLASGQRLSAFALTEPCAGSDLTALKTKAVLDGNDYVVNGEKLFITNAVAGRTVGLVCLIDDKPSVLIADLPEAENEHFQTKKYGLYALKHTHNNGLLFRDFRVPRENLLTPSRGDGLTIAYHGLNRGRVALCANAAGTMRIMLASILPWAHFRRTYGNAIETRELVRRRIGRLAALIVGCDAMTEWCAWLLDEGYRGEMECIIAKIFGSESQKEAAVELLMKTHGGRAFLHGHLFGDQVHEFLAPCIYEGEGEMLGMAFLKSLIKEHGKQFFEPIGRALQATGIKQFNPANPVHAWKLRAALVPYAKWRLKQIGGGRIQLPHLTGALRRHAEFAAHGLQKSRLWIDSTMTKHQLKLADRQCAMSELSQRIQDLVVMLATSLYAAKQDDEIVRSAADVLCQDLKRRLTGARLTSQYFRTVTKLGETIAGGGFQALAGVEAEEILMPYQQ